MKLRKLLYILSITTVSWLGASVQAQADLAERFTSLTKDSEWQLVSEALVDFTTHHTQGMTKVGDTMFVSAVEIVESTERYNELQNGYDRSPGKGVGHLFKFDLEGKLLDSITLGEGNIYHPGGIDYDGRYIWVPVAEYRPNSASIMYRVDPQTMVATEVFRFPDHIGGVVHNPDSASLNAVSWGSRRLYTFTLDEALNVTNAEQDPETLYTLNKSYYIDYQDCEYVGANQMLCSGLSNYQILEDGPSFPLGGIDLVELDAMTPTHQLPITLWTKAEEPQVMTQNPFYIETTRAGIRAYFMPEDDSSHLFIYDIAAAQ